MILAEQLCKDYGPVKAVIDLDFHVNRGEILGILGPNGAGKTTTLRMLTGFLPPTSGLVRIDGIEMAEAPMEAKKRIGYLPEASPLVPEMLTFDYLYHIARLRDLQKEEILPRILQLADECSIRNVMHRPIGALSKGYRQRVGVSAALLSDPGALVLDEPTSGLDPIQIIEFHKLLRQLGEQKAIIFSTHILSEAEAVCDRVIIVNQGRLAAQKFTKTEEGIRQPAQELQLLLTGGTEEEYRERLSSLKGIKVRAVHRERDNLCRINLYEEGDQRRTIYQTVKTEKNWDLLELSRQQKSLESLFREITREEHHED